MKKYILFPVLTLAIMSFTVLLNYSATDEGSSIKFKIKNFGITVDGTFKGLQGNFNFDPNNLTAATFEASLDANTVNTGNNSRDNHLRKDEFFGVQKYPRIKLVSTKIGNSSKTGSYVMNAKLTIKNVTKDISFPFTATPNGADYLFAAEFKINRRDFGVGGSSISMADNLTVFLSVTAKKK
jgi:polyisoprenoid-binding protein YceI